MEFMKANRKFKLDEDEAVSAVIGVILMVAITVAIAATVYVYVSGMIGTSPQSTPNLQLVKDDVNDKLTVASADPGDLEWEDFAINYNAGSENITLYWTYDGGGSTNLVTGNWTTYIEDTGTLVQAGDYFELDESGTVSIRHIGTNTLIGTWEFS